MDKNKIEESKTAVIEAYAKKHGLKIEKVEMGIQGERQETRNVGVDTQEMIKRIRNEGITHVLDVLTEACVEIAFDVPTFWRVAYRLRDAREEFQKAISPHEEEEE